MYRSIIGFLATFLLLFETDGFSKDIKPLFKQLRLQSAIGISEPFVSRWRA